MKVYFFNDSRSQNNWGCRATTLALRRMIYEGGHEIIGSFKLSRATRLAGGTGGAAGRLLDLVPAIRSRVRHLMWLLERRRGVLAGRVWSLSDFEPLSQAILDNKVWQDDLPLLKQADAFIVNGEGSIYGKEQKGLLTLFFCYFVTKHLGRPCALVNHTADLSDPVMAEAAAAVYPMLADVVFREPISARNWGHMAPQISDNYAPDAAFTDLPRLGSDWLRDVERPGALDLWPYTADGFDPEAPYVALLGSSALGRPDKAEPFPEEAFGKIIAKLRAQGLQTFVLASDSTDEAPMARVAARSNCPFLPAATPLPIATDVLANAACLVGGRWHPAILASTGGAPSVMFSANTTKTTALLEMLGLSQVTFDVAHLERDADLICAAARDYVSQGESLRERVRATARGLAKHSWRNVRILEAGNL